MKSRVTRHCAFGIGFAVNMLIASIHAGNLDKPTSISIRYDYDNEDARTRLSSMDGPLAGMDIFVYAFAGFTPLSLQPVPPNVGQHFQDLEGNPTGFFVLYPLIPFIPQGTPGFAQVVAWDGSIWGSDITKVPESQLGYSEVVPFPPDRGRPGPPPALLLTKPIIVPAIPEPQTWVLLAIGGLLMGTVYLRKR